MATGEQNGRSWWTFEQPTSGTAWRPNGTTLLEGLLQQVPDGDEPRPWQSGYELQIQGLGGFVNKERRHHTILGGGSYASSVGGNRTVLAGTQTTEAQGERSVLVAKPADPGDLDAPWGVDSLTVEGDADITVGSRMVMMSGTLDRTWNGGVVRLASMEGTICGGGFLRLHASPSATLSGMMTGDVYGGIIRASVTRTYLAVLEYRAAKAAAWAIGAYTRNCTFVIEPIIGSPSSETPKSSLARKLFRLGKVLEVARMICPPLDILVGLASLPLAIYGIGALIYGLVRSSNAVPPSGPPRTRTRTCGLTSQVAASLIVT